MRPSGEIWAAADMQRHLVGRLGGWAAHQCLYEGAYNLCVHNSLAGIIQVCSPCFQPGGLALKKLLALAMKALLGGILV